MQQDFHYYATYCAAILAGFTHDESLKICYSAEMVDHCSRTYLQKIHGPKDAATTQLQLELANADTSVVGLQDITRIWAAFHFLPGDLYADPGRGSKRYKNKYRLICKPNGELLIQTVALAKRAGTLPAIGLAMHVLADTWAHQFFAGTPSLVINNTDYYFYELIPKEDGEGYQDRPVVFVHNPSAPDDLVHGRYTGTMYQASENAVMNLGHGRAGHLPDYSFMRYKYLPAWADYKEMIKDNPSDYYHAFCQMVYAMKYLRGETESFEKDTYAWDLVAPYKDEIMAIIEKRQKDACADWKAFGEKLSGHDVYSFAMDSYDEEYMDRDAEEKRFTYLGQFIEAALAQKRMVTNQIFQSGSLLAGYSINQMESIQKGFAGLFGRRKRS